MIALTLTDTAATMLRKLYHEHLPTKNIFHQLLCLGVKEGGCAGMEYSLALEEPEKEDLILELHGVKIAIKKDSQELLNGITIDFKQTKVKPEQLFSGFVIKNPHATKTCGCGNSFSTVS